MNKLYILIISIVFFNCNSKIDESKINSSEEKPQTEIKTTVRNHSENIPSIIYDTLVFTEFMKGNSLDKKINESKDKLHFYKKLIKSSEINQLQIIDEKHTKTEIKYLGELKDIDNENSYKVITNFKIIDIKIFGPSLENVVSLTEGGEVSATKFVTDSGGNQVETQLTDASANQIIDDKL